MKIAMKFLVGSVGLAVLVIVAVYVVSQRPIPQKPESSNKTEAVANTKFTVKTVILKREDWGIQPGSNSRGSLGSLSESGILAIGPISMKATEQRKNVVSLDNESRRVKLATGTLKLKMVDEKGEAVSLSSDMDKWFENAKIEHHTLPLQAPISFTHNAGEVVFADNARVVFRFTENESGKIYDIGVGPGSTFMVQKIAGEKYKRKLLLEETAEISPPFSK